MTFEELKICPALLKTVAGYGYETPTPIQNDTIPHALDGRDVMGLAQTGTGKTAAFVLPILQRLMDGPRGHVRALVVAPTRELADQIHETFNELGKGLKMRSMVIYGGVNINPQAQKLREGIEIVVACPGRLLDHIGQGFIRLNRLEVLVLDEADRMFDMGFLPDVRKIVKQIPAKRQTLLFSATMPADIRRLTNEILTDPVVVQVDISAPVETVSHALYPVAPHLKTSLLIELLRRTDKESVLVFTRTKHRAKRVGEQLEKAGFTAASLQGNLSQNRRQAALEGFRDGTYQVMVATDIAARGIDVSKISHVVNYDVPDTADAYTHRIGRTGRAAKTGDAFTLVSPEDTDMVRTIEKLLGSKPETRTLEGFDYSIPAPTRPTEFARPPLPPRRPRSDKPKARPSGPRQPSGPAGNNPAAKSFSKQPSGSVPGARAKTVLRRPK